MKGRFPILPNRQGINLLIPTCRQVVNRFKPRLVIIIPGHPPKILVAPVGNGPKQAKRVSVIPPFVVTTLLTVERKRLQALLKFITNSLVLLI